MKKALLSIVSLTLLLPYHSFAMEKKRKASQEKLKFAFGSNTIDNIPLDAKVQPSVANLGQGNRFSSLNQLEIESLASYINGYNEKAKTSDENGTTETKSEIICLVSSLCGISALGCTCVIGAYALTAIIVALT